MTIQPDGLGLKMLVELLQPPAARVELITHTLDPIYLIAVLCKGYEHVYSADDPGYEYASKALEQIAKTELQGPLEMVHFTWLITNVTRAFTHQLVRYRVGTAFVQESLRFSPKTTARVLDTTGGDPEYAAGVERAMAAYRDMVARGVPIQDARGILPTNILTSIFFDCSLRTLVHIWAQRTCTQAQQSEWPTVLSQMKAQLRDFDSSTARLSDLLALPCDQGKPCGYDSVWDRWCPKKG